MQSSLHKQIEKGTINKIKKTKLRTNLKFFLVKSPSKAQQLIPSSRALERSLTKTNPAAHTECNQPEYGT